MLDPSDWVCNSLDVQNYCKAFLMALLAYQPCYIHLTKREIQQSSQKKNMKKIGAKAHFPTETLHVQMVHYTLLIRVQVIVSHSFKFVANRFRKGYA